MKKILISILFLIPLLALGNVESFQTPSDPAGKYKGIELGGIYKVYFAEYDGVHNADNKYKSLFIWSDAFGHYVCCSDIRNDITQLLAIMSEGWDICDVILYQISKGDHNSKKDYFFTSFDCANIGTKMNNDSHFSGCDVIEITDQAYVNDLLEFYKYSKPI